jgi:hypothetical protein
MLLKERIAVNRKNHKKHVKLHQICGQRTHYLTVTLPERVKQTLYICMEIQHH